MEPDVERLLALVRRELGAQEARVIDLEGDRGSSSSREGPADCELRCVLPGPGKRALVVRFDAAPTEREAKQRRLEMLASTFDAIAVEDPGVRPRSRPPVARSLQDELRALCARAEATNALVVDANSPVVWGAADADVLGPDLPLAGEMDEEEEPTATHGPRVVPPAPASAAALAASRSSSTNEADESPTPPPFRARDRQATLELVAPPGAPPITAPGAPVTAAPGAPVTAAPGAPAGVTSLVGRRPSSPPPPPVDPESPAPLSVASRGPSRAAVEAVRALPAMAALRKGKHLRHIERGAPGHYIAHSFAGIYCLVVVYDAPFDELRAERAMSESLGRIEQLVLALPPLDPEPSAGAGAVSIRRARRK